MNNNKIIFGIIIFCAISFLAFTFANPLEKEDDDFIKDNQTNGEKVNKPTNNGKDNEIQKPVKVEDDKKEEENKPTTTTPTVNYPTYTPTPSNPTPQPSTPVVDNSPRYATVTTSTPGITISQNKDLITLTGEIENPDDLINIVFTSPEVYSEETLNGTEIYLGYSGGTYGKAALTTTGNGTDKATFAVNHGFFNYGEVNEVSIYWGTRTKVTYKLTFNITVKNQKPILPDDPVVPDPTPEEPTPDTPETPEVTD